MPSTIPAQPIAAISIRGLTFSYDGQAPLFQNLHLEIPQKSRTLLLGANGVGKSTLLRLASGRHMIPEDQLKIFGYSPYHDLSFSRQISFIDGDFPLKIDVTV